MGVNIVGSNPETGKTKTIEFPHLPPLFLEQLATVEFPKKVLQTKIDNLPVSADVKALLYQMGLGVMKVGSTIIRVGQKIVEIVLKIAARFPNASFGLIFGAIAGTLIAGIPIIGFILGPIVKPLLAAMGLMWGAKEDFANAALERRIMEAVATFEPLKGE